MPVAKKPAAKSALKLAAKSVAKQVSVKPAAYKVLGATKAKPANVARPAGVKASEKAAIKKFVGVVTNALSNFLTESFVGQISKTASTRPSAKAATVRPAAKKAAAKPAAKKVAAKPAAKRAAAKPAAKKAAGISVLKKRATSARAGGETTSTGPGKKA